MRHLLIDAVYHQDLTAYRTVVDNGIELLPDLAEHLSTDAPIDVLERFEAILKHILFNCLMGHPTAETARRVVLFQKNLGFLYKYKSYAIKASTPLGYSIFIQKEREGFSYQRHLSRKTEVFHIVEVSQGGYVFICDFEDWSRHYNHETFSAWLSGETNENYERYRVQPNPGDVFVIDRLSVVHTVVGCVLEEFATVSTDMVDRLFDQNAGKQIPREYTQRYSQERLQKISYPNTNHVIEARNGKWEAAEINPDQIPGGRSSLLAKTPVITAFRHVVDPFKSTIPQIDDVNTRTIHITQGIGSVIIADDTEIVRSSPPTVAVSKGDVLLIPTKMFCGFVNEGTIPLEISEHIVPAELALIEEQTLG